MQVCVMLAPGQLERVDALRAAAQARALPPKRISRAEVIRELLDEALRERTRRAANSAA